MARTRPRSCRLRLEDSAKTRALDPFAFRFEVIYAIEAGRLDIPFVITNPSSDVLPASAGAHPAFRWPLCAGIAKDAHRLDFAKPEPHSIRRLGPDGLLDRTEFPSPVEGKTLPLSESLFKISAIIFDRPVSRSLRYSAPGAPGIDVAWDGFCQLGLWMKPGAGFLCIEPWYGMTSPSDFDGDFIDKPGLLLIPPGEQRVLTHSISIIASPTAVG